MKIYDKLYDIVAENDKMAGKEFEYYKNTYLCDVKNHPQVIDVSKYLFLENKEFAQAVFVGIFKRLPEKNELLPWEDKYTMGKERFQESFLRKMVKSSVVAIQHVQFINNPYFVQKKGLRYCLLGKLYGLTDKSSLRVLGKKLPGPIQKVIRKVFL